MTFPDKIFKVGFIKLITVSLFACSTNNDDGAISGEKTVNLHVYNIDSKVMRNIIDNVIIQDLIESRIKPDQNFIHLEIISDNGIIYLQAYSWEINHCYDYISTVDGWFVRDDYQFVITDSTKKYFSYTPQTHVFNYYYISEPDFTDEMEWIIEVNKDSYLVKYRFKG